ncbi:MAG: DUF2807 domain-containing protein [Bacteroidales bacterium]
MKKIILISCFLVSLTLLSAQDKVTRTYQLEPFDAINASFIYEMEVFKGNEYSLELVIPQDLAREVEIQVSGKVLNLGVTREWWRLTTNVIGKRHTIQARITMPHLTGVELSNAASLITRDNFNPANFKVKLSGASNAELNILTHAVNVDISGASNLEISGLATVAKVYVSGASELRYNQETDQIDLKASGASTVIMKGSSTKGTFEVSGASSVKAFEFQMEELSLKCSGASNAKVYVTGKITPVAGGASDIHVKGDPEFTKSVSRGASSIKSVN